MHTFVIRCRGNDSRSRLIDSLRLPRLASTQRDRSAEQRDFGSLVDAEITRWSVTEIRLLDGFPVRSFAGLSSVRDRRRRFRPKVIMLEWGHRIQSDDCGVSKRAGI